MYHHPKIPNYLNDGAGRDTYISFFNGGFSKCQITNRYLKEKYESPTHTRRHDLSLCKPVKRYFRDGCGRDSYIYNFLLDENTRYPGNIKLDRILRSYDKNNHPFKTSKNLSPSKFEKKLIHRIFYTKCKDKKDKIICPKLNYTKVNHEDDAKDSSFERSEQYFFDEKKKKNSKNYCLTEGDENKVNQSTKIKFNNYKVDMKKSFRNYRPELLDNDYLVNSVKKIFLYNSNKSNKKDNLFDNINLSRRNQNLKEYSIKTYNDKYI